MFCARPVCHLSGSSVAHGTDLGVVTMRTRRLPPASVGTAATRWRHSHVVTDLAYGFSVFFFFFKCCFTSTETISAQD